MTDKLLDCFPDGNTPRKNQIEVLNKIQESLDKKTKFIIVQCPTGTGKSHIGKTIGNYSKKCNSKFKKLVINGDIFKKTFDDGGVNYEYEDEVKELEKWGCSCLTVTKHLQNQYVELFDDSVSLKGKSNYICNIDPSFTVDVAPCTSSWKIGEDCLLSDICMYYNQFKSSLISKFGVYNYSKFLSIPPFMRERQFLVCDEASEIEDMLVNYFSVQIKYKYLDYFNISYENTKIDSDITRENFKWLYRLQKRAQKEAENAKATITSEYCSKKDKEFHIRKLKFCKNLKESIDIAVSGYRNTDYVTYYDKDGCTFTPLYVNTLSNFLWGDHEHVILMSGTIFDKETFARTLGIEEYDYIEVDSEFDGDKSPIYIPAEHSINYKNQDSVLPKVIKQAHEISETFKNENGIIHTHTNKITNAFKKQISKTNRYLYRQEGSTNEDILYSHTVDSSPTVLVSPSMAFGVDLPDDMSRFQIIMKLPFPPLQDKRTKKLFDLDKKWYTMKMYTKFIQMCGRSTRTPDDYCSTYILDKTVIYSLKKEWNNLPQYFKKRIK